MLKLLRHLALFLVLASPLTAEDSKALSAPQLIAAVKAAKPVGGVFVRVRMEQTSASGKATLQVQIKRRTTADGVSEHLYQVLFPKERKGEAILLRVTEKGFTGSLFMPGKGITKLKASDRRTPVFGTDMTVEDLLADFLDWTQHRSTGNENVGNVACNVVESRPSGSTTGLSKVVSWIDEKRLAALRIHLFDGGDKPARIVETGRLLRGESGYYIPASFTVSTPAKGTSTLVEGARSDSGITYSDADFTEAAMQVVTGAK